MVVGGAQLQAPAETVELVEHVARGEPAERLRAQVARRHPEATLDQVDDAFQEACLLAVGRARGRSEGEVFTWIRTTTTRKVSEIVARSRREWPVDTVALDGLCAGDGEGPADELIGREDEADLGMLMASVLARLSERQRDVVALHAHGRNRPQIAEHLGITRRTVKREIERILAVGRTELARFAGGGCAEGEQLVRRLAFGLAASPQERGGARLHLATCARCAAFHERLEAWHQKAAAMVPLPAAEAASPGVAERALHGASDAVAGLKQQLVDGSAQLKQHAASAYYRAVDPTPFSAMRPGAAATAIAGCLALGGGATYCAQQGVDPLGELRGVVMPAPEKETPQAESPAATPPVSAPAPSPPPDPAPTPEPAAPAPAPPQAPPAQPTPAPSEAAPSPAVPEREFDFERARPSAPRAPSAAPTRGGGEFL